MPAPMAINFGGNRVLPADKEVTPLHVAVANLNLDLARFLIAHGADVNARDAEGRTPLHVAVNRRDLETMRVLLDAKSDPDAKDTAGWTPSRWAADVPSMRSTFQIPDRRSFWQAERKDILDLLAGHGAKDSTATNAVPAAGVSPVAARPATQGVARVLGEVNRPGTVSLGLGSRKDIIDAIAECGGFTEKARPQFEFTRSGVTQKFTLDELKAETDPARKLWLEPGDTIEVKPKVF